MKGKYKKIISSEHNLFDLHIKETFQYRDLIYLFVKRDFTTVYKQTILGPLWAIIQPLLTTVVFTIVFGNLAGLTTADCIGEYSIPSFLFYMIGNICWSYFSGTLNATSNTFINNKAIMGKVYYPRLVSPISTALSHLISFFIQMAMFMLIWAAFIIFGETSIKVTPMLFMLPLLIVQMMLLSVGLGIIISSVTTKYRDLAMLVGFGLQLWQYGTPVAYGLTLITNLSDLHPTLVNIYMINPMTSIITAFRYVCFGFGYFNMGYYVISLIITLVVFLTGLVMFSKIERTFMDTI